MLNSLMLKIPPQFVVWIYDTFDNNSKNKNDFKIPEGELWVVFGLTFFLQIFTLSLLSKRFNRNCEAAFGCCEH